MFDNTESLLDLIQSYRNDENSGSLADKYADESIHNQSSLYDVSPVDYHNSDGDGIKSGFHSGNQSQLAEHSIQNVFNLRKENSGHLDVMNKMRGIQANRLDNETGSISLAENYADRALDSRAMDGLYNITLSDIYADKTRFMAFHGLFADGMIDIKGNTGLDIETGPRQDSFEGTVMGNHQLVGTEKQADSKTQSSYYQGTSLYSSSEENHSSNEKTLGMSSVTASMLGRMSESSTELVSEHSKPKERKHDSTSHTGSVSAFDSAKDVDLVKHHKTDSYNAAKAIDNDGSVYLKPVEVKESTTDSYKAMPSIILKGDGLIEDPFDKSQEDPEESSETTHLSNKNTSEEEKYDGTYDAKTMRPWIKEHQQRLNISKVIDVDDIQEYEGDQISALILAQEADLQDKIKKSETVSEITGLTAPERNFAVEEHGLALSSTLKIDSVLERAEKGSISAQILETEAEWKPVSKENKESLFGDMSPERNYDVEKQGTHLSSSLKDESNLVSGHQQSITDKILEEENEIRNKVFKREEVVTNNFTGGIIPKKNYEVEEQGSNLTSLLKDESAVEIIIATGLATSILEENSKIISKVVTKKEVQSEILVSPKRDFNIEKQGTQLGILMQKEFETNNGVRFNEKEYYDEKELEKKKTELELKMTPILKKMRKEEVKSLLVSFEDKLLYSTFEEKLIINLKIAIAKKFL